jgi:hypothetical protein
VHPRLLCILASVHGQGAEHATRIFERKYKLALYPIVANYSLSVELSYHYSLGCCSS